jgi:hypothetical protein
MRSKKIASFYGVLFLLCVIGAAHRPATAQVQVPRVATLPIRNRQTVPKPRLLTQTQKLQVAQKILSGTGQKASSLETPIVLDLFHLFVKDKAHLIFSMPSQIDPIDSIVEFSPSNQSYAQVVVPPPSPGIYLIDFSVGLLGGSSNFSLTTSNSVETKMLYVFDSQHVFSVAIVKPGEVFPINVVVSASTPWYFHSCEISKVN